MSVEAMARVLRYIPTVPGSKMNHGKRLILLLLANRHNRDEGIAWPSMKLLAQEAGLDIRYTRVHINQLEDAGLIRREPRHREGTGAQTTNGYRFCGPLALEEETPGTLVPPPPVTSTLPPRIRSASPPGTLVPPPPAQGCLPLLLNKLAERASELTPEQPQERRKVVAARKAHPAVQPWPEDRRATVQSLWSEHVADGTLKAPNIRDLLTLEDEALATGKPELAGLLEYAIKETGKYATGNRLGYTFRVMRAQIDGGGKQRSSTHGKRTIPDGPDVFDDARVAALNEAAMERLLRHASPWEEER